MSADCSQKVSRDLHHPGSILAPRRVMLHSVLHNGNALEQQRWQGFRRVASTKADRQQLDAEHTFSLW